MQFVGIYFAGQQLDDKQSKQYIHYHTLEIRGNLIDVRNTYFHLNVETRIIVLLL